MDASPDEVRRVDHTALRNAADRLQMAVRGSNVGLLEIDMPDGIVRNGRVDVINMLEQLGYERPAAPTDFATSIALVHPDDAEPLERAIAAHLAGATPELAAAPAPPATAKSFANSTCATSASVTPAQPPSWSSSTASATATGRTAGCSRARWPCATSRANRFG